MENKEEDIKGFVEKVLFGCPKWLSKPRQLIDEGKKYGEFLKLDYAYTREGECLGVEFFGLSKNIPPFNQEDDIEIKISKSSPLRKIVFKDVEFEQDFKIEIDLKTTNPSNTGTNGQEILEMAHDFVLYFDGVTTKENSRIFVSINENTRAFINVANSKIRGTLMFVVSCGGGEKIRYDPSTLQFGGANRIDNVIINQVENFNVWLNQYQTIGTEWGDIERIGHHRSLFLNLKKKAAEAGDTAQVNILKREILKCDRRLLQREGFQSCWDKVGSFQDRFILWFESISSNYGFSWLRPLGWLILFNFMFALMFFCCKDFGNIFFNLFRPWSGIQETSCIHKMGNWGAFLMILQNIFFAVLVYQIIKSFRRFSRK